MEINELRPFFIKAMEVKGKLFAAPLDNDNNMAGTADATFGTGGGWGNNSFDMDTT
jgi:hypothetical protein